MDVLVLILVLIIIGLGVGLITLWLERTKAVRSAPGTTEIASAPASPFTKPPRPIKIRLKRIAFADGTTLEVDVSHRPMSDSELQALHPDAQLTSVVEITKITRIEKHGN